jgi:hypothetical protein
MAIYKKMRTALGDSTELSHKVYVDGDAGAGTTDYLKLDNKPMIAGVVLEHDKSLGELGIQEAGDYVTRDEMPDIPSNEDFTLAGLGEKSYNSLTDKPEIPSLDGYATETWVEDKKYLTEHQDISGYALIAESGAKITLEINDEYKIVAKLYDKNENQISESVAIDLPLEGMIVGGDYDATTKEVILTLTNGDDIRFSVADLVSGLQTEITTSNPLNVKYISGLANVATSGSYNDLTNKPTIPAAQINADWNATAGLAMILNKPAIPTKVSELTNDKNYMTEIPESYTAAIEEALGTKVDLANGKKVVDTTKTYEDNIWYNANAINGVCNDFIGDLESIAKSVPTTTSQLTNNSGFITKSVSDLTNYTNNNSLSALMSAKQNITDNTLNTTNKTVAGAINEVNSIAKGANQAIGFGTYADMIDHLSAQGKGSYRLGQSIYITTLGVPDLWISEILDTAVTYTYTSDADFIATLGLNGKVQVGHYCVSALETQKVDLTNYVKNTDYATGAKAGLVRPAGGLYMGGSNKDALLIAKASEEQIDARKDNNYPIVPSNLEYAVKSVVGGHVVVTQKEYDDMVAAGTIDENTFYYFKGE